MWQSPCNVHGVKLLLAGALLGVVAFAQPDPKVLIRRSVENYERDWHAATRWGYTQTDVTRADGTNEVDVSEVFPLEGTPYERLIRKGGRALSSDEQRKEDEKYRKAVRQRQAETPAERAGRIDKYEQQRAFIREIPGRHECKECVPGHGHRMAVATLLQRPRPVDMLLRSQILQRSFYDLLCLGVDCYRRIHWHRF